MENAENKVNEEAKNVNTEAKVESTTEAQPAEKKSWGWKTWTCVAVGVAVVAAGAAWVMTRKPGEAAAVADEVAEAFRF